jgi:hypothetical protein
VVALWALASAQVESTRRSRRKSEQAQRKAGIAAAARARHMMASAARADAARRASEDMRGEAEAADAAVKKENRGGAPSGSLIRA